MRKLRRTATIATTARMIGSFERLSSLGDSIASSLKLDLAVHNAWSAFGIEHRHTSRKSNLKTE